MLYTHELELSKPYNLMIHTRTNVAKSLVSLSLRRSPRILSCNFVFLSGDTRVGIASGCGTDKLNHPPMEAATNKFSTFLVWAGFLSFQILVCIVEKYGKITWRNHNMAKPPSKKRNRTNYVGGALPCHPPTYKL